MNDHTPQTPIDGVLTVGVPVSDQDRALEFYPWIGSDSRSAGDVPVPQFGGRWIEVASARSHRDVRARAGTGAGGAGRRDRHSPE